MSLKMKRLLKGPTGNEVRIKLAQLALSTDGKPFALTFTVDEGPEGDPTPVEKDFLIAGFRHFGGNDAIVELYPPITGDGSFDEKVSFIFYPTAPQGFVGNMQIEDEAA